MKLPAFLLATADWRGFWKGCSRLRPAQNEPWSGLLVLGLTVGYTLMAVCLGLILSLVFYRQPVAWVMWLSGSYMVAAGLCWFGLTALCWNQRAARLRANPALVTGLPRLKFRLFRWGLGLIYFVLVAVFTPLAILLTIENVRAEWAWRNERARLIAQGERLTLREILGPEIPDDQNAGAAAIFAPLFDYQNVNGVHGKRAGVIWRDTNAVQQFNDKLARPDGKHWPKEDANAPRTPQVNLATWAEVYRHLASAPTKDDPSWAAELKLPPASVDPARVVLTGLAIADETLAAVCAASTRPRARFAIHFDETYYALLGHLSSLKSVNRALELRCAARLAVGETNAAFADAECALRASDLLREEPFLISQLVRFATTAIAVRTVWQGLAGHQWTEVQLAALQDQLGRVNFLPGMVAAFEGERACSLATLEQMIKAPGSMAAEFGGDGETGAPPNRFMRLLSILPRGVVRQNEIALARYHTAMLDTIRAAVSNAPQTGLATMAQAAAANPGLKLIERDQSPYGILARKLAPATGRAVAKAARAQTIAHMAVVACALERYHLQHAAFPEKLDDLVPAFLPTPPIDPMNRQPFQYHRTEDGWFQLYSVGPNGKDDGGVFMVKTNRVVEEKDWPWPVPSRPEARRLF